MRILVGIKWVPNTQAVRFDPETGTLIRKGVPSIVNPHDLPALEVALRLKEQVGGEVIAFSMAPPPAAKGLELAIGMGADLGILVTDRAFAGADTLATSYTLSKAVKKVEEERGKIDLILFGHETIDSSTSHIQAQVASWLGWPYIYHVKSVSAIDDKTLRVVRELENYVEEYEVETPAVISVSIKAVKPRAVSLRNKLRAKLEKRVIIWTNAELKLDPRCVGLKGSPTWVAKTIDMPEVPRKKEVYKPKDAKDAARWIIRKMVEDEKLREVIMKLARGEA